MSRAINPKLNMRTISAIFAILASVAGGIFIWRYRLYVGCADNRLQTCSPQRFWKVQSVDTVKQSRDLAREKAGDLSYNAVIDRQMAAIAELGATHAAIDTPYDEEFVPYLTRWVSSARKHGLSVWFRGNFSGWEGWFSYPPISRQDHMRKLRSFILSHREIFADGDVFTPCPECENGLAGDPRNTGDIAGFRSFLIEEQRIAKAAFASISRDVVPGYMSANGDVAALVMDKATAALTGGVVAVDHFVASPEKLSSDFREFSERSDSDVAAGELGAPLPDIHGYMTDDEQARWLDRALSGLAGVRRMQAVNYWVGFGGTTAIFDEAMRPKPAANILSSYYRPRLANGRVIGNNGLPVSGAIVSSGAQKAIADREGRFSLPRMPNRDIVLSVQALGYADKNFTIKSESDDVSVLEITQISRQPMRSFIHFINKILKRSGLKQAIG